jgi:hypothetical protein
MVPTVEDVMPSIESDDTANNTRYNRIPISHFTKGAWVGAVPSLHQLRRTGLGNSGIIDDLTGESCENTGDQEEAKPQQYHSIFKFPI